MCVRLCLAALVVLVLAGCGSQSFTGGTPIPATSAIVTLAFSPKAVQPGQSATLTWSSANANTCVASGAWSGPQPIYGMQNVVLSGPQNLSFTLACTGPAGTTTQTTSLQVAPPQSACAAKPAMRPRADRRNSRKRPPPLPASGS